MSEQDLIGPDAEDRVRVLIADDTQGIRFLLRAALEVAGGFLVVAEAADGAEVIELAALHQPDLVLLDMGMPVMDGLQALPLILERSPSSKIVVFSGFCADKLADEAYALGAAGFIEKGLNVGELVSRLLVIVDKKVATPT